MPCVLRALDSVTGVTRVSTRSLYFQGSGCLLGKVDKVRNNMAQIASLPAIAAVFIGLWTPISFFSQGGGKAHTQDKATYAGT